MTRKTKVLRTLTLYFMEKGKIMNRKEYMAQSDVPYKANTIAGVFTSWSIIPKMIKKNFPLEYEQIVNPPKPVETKVIKPVKTVAPKTTTKVVKAKKEE